MKDKLLVACSLIALLTIGSVLCAISNMSLYHQIVNEAHTALVNGVHAVFTGAVILFFTALALGTAIVLVKLNHMRKVQVIGANKYGPAQVVVFRNEVIQLQSPTANQTDRVREMQDIMRFAVTMANATKRLAPDTEEVPLLEGPKEAIPAVVRYEQVERDVPSDMSLLGIHPASGDLELTDWEKLKMLWVVGSSSSGKSNTVYGKVYEAVRRGARLLVVDPHAVKEDSLARKLAPFESAFLCPVASKENEILAVFNAFITEFEQRLEGKASTPRIVLICDEVNHMMRVDALKAPLRNVVEICGEESRGFGMYGWFISQKCAHLKWLRDSAITVIAHALTRFEEAKLACNDDGAAAKRLINFKVGRTYIYGVDFDSPMELQQPLYGAPKLDNPGTYPDGEFLPETNGETAGNSFSYQPQKNEVSSKQTAAFVESVPETNGETAGNRFETENTDRPFELKKMLLDIKKMSDAGMSREKILQSYGLRGDGRNNGDLKVVLDVLSSTVEEA